MNVEAVVFLVSGVCGVIAFLTTGLVVACGRAGYWRGKYEALNDECADHLDTIGRYTKFLECAIDSDAFEASRNVSGER